MNPFKKLFNPKQANATSVNTSEESPILTKEPQLYYIQIKGAGFVGNAISFYTEGLNGHTTNINNAHLFTKEQAELIQKQGPNNNIVWPQEYIESISIRIADSQFLNKTKSGFISLLLFLTLLVTSCQSSTEPIIMKDSYKGKNFKKIEVDGCEYIYLGYWFAHKGNCKFCKKSKLNEKLNKDDIALRL